MTSIRNIFMVQVENYEGKDDQNDSQGALLEIILYILIQFTSLVPVIIICSLLFGWT